MEDREKDKRKLVYIFKKTERISTALYAVSGLFAHSEPLRMSFRKFSVSLVTLSSKLEHDRTDFGIKDTLSDIRKTLDQILSFCNLAKNAEVMSSMNHRILSTEIGNLNGVINSILVGTGFINDGELDPKSFEIPVVFQGSERPVSVPKIRNSDVSKVVTKQGEDRREAILNVLRSKTLQSVKEITESADFAGKVSEKTIQRELVSLVEQGVVKRVGERRWSRYSI